MTPHRPSRRPSRCISSPSPSARQGRAAATIAIAPAGIECGAPAPCSASFSGGTRVTLTASPAPGPRSAAGAGPVLGYRLLHRHDRLAAAVTAAFTRLPSFALSVTGLEPAAARSRGARRHRVRLDVLASFTGGTVVTLSASQPPGPRSAAGAGPAARVRELQRHDERCAGRHGERSPPAALEASRTIRS